MAVMSIVNAFHDNDVNVRRAQLVFTTHNPIFLDNNLFRRDEIKFVERDDDTGESVTYALSDFGTSGPNAVRRNEDYQQRYFMGRYGGIKDIDLVPFLKEQVQRGLHMDLTPEGASDLASTATEGAM
jgi:AAA15 family ATPase/GTPase